MKYMQNKIIGSWSLISQIRYCSDGSSCYPLGKKAKGYLCYMQNNQMLVMLSGDERPFFQTGSKLSGSVDEKLAAHDSFLAYAGKYRVEGNRIIHISEISCFPNWEGGVEHVRFFELKQNYLILKTPKYQIENKEYHIEIKWEKAV